jgi:hypothetical protein
LLEKLPASYESPAGYSICKTLEIQTFVKIHKVFIFSQQHHKHLHHFYASSNAAEGTAPYTFG